MSLAQSMARVVARREEVEAKLSESASLSPDELASLSRELSELRPVCEQVDLVRRLEEERESAEGLVAEAGDDAELVEMARAEIQDIDGRLPDEMKALQLLLLPRDKDDSRNAILEVRAGTGGAAGDEPGKSGSRLIIKSGDHLMRKNRLVPADGGGKEKPAIKRGTLDAGIGQPARGRQQNVACFQAISCLCGRRHSSPSARRCAWSSAVSASTTSSSASPATTLSRL